MGPVLRWSDVKESRLSCLWVKRAFTLAEPRLDWGAVVRGHGLVRLDMLNILGNVMLGALGLRLLPVTLQGQLREQWIVFSSGEDEDLRQEASLQKIKWEKQSLSFGHRCGAGQRLSNA
ncbi:unnamed protein product [Prunus armeniaca]